MTLGCGDVIKGFEAARARTFTYMAEALIASLGEEKGRKAVEKAVISMSRGSGEQARSGYEAQGVPNTWRRHREANAPVYALAWVGGVTQDSPDRKVVEYTYCPLADGFKKLGERAEELGDIYCAEVDDAFWSGFNPEWTVTREKTFRSDGVCRLVWKRS